MQILVSNAIINLLVKQILVSSYTMNIQPQVVHHSQAITKQAVQHNFATETFYHFSVVLLNCSVHWRAKQNCPTLWA